MQWPKTLWIRYVWVEQLEQDDHLTLNALFLLGFVLSVAVVVCAFMDSQQLLEDEDYIVVTERADEVDYKDKAR